MIFVSGGGESGEDTIAKHHKPQWNSFVKGLQRSGAFGGEIEGSAIYKAELEKARKAFLAQIQQFESKMGTELPAERCKRLLMQNVPFQENMVLSSIPYTF